MSIKAGTLHTGPAAFLPAYDNRLLSYADRSRVIPGNPAVPLPPGDGATTGTFLVDSIWRGTWQIQDQTLHIQLFTTLRCADRNALFTEAVQLCALVAPHARYHIVLDKPWIVGRSPDVVDRPAPPADTRALRDWRWLIARPSPEVVAALVVPMPYPATRRILGKGWFLTGSALITPPRQYRSGRRLTFN